MRNQSDRVADKETRKLKKSVGEIEEEMSPVEGSIMCCLIVGRQHFLSPFTVCFQLSNMV